jgi:hypothetical protein
MLILKRPNDPVALEREAVQEIQQTGATMPAGRRP